MSAARLILLLILGLTTACIPPGGGGGGDDDGGPFETDGAVDPDDGVPAPDMAPDPDDGVPPPDMALDPDDGVPPPDMAPDPDDGVSPPDMALPPDAAECAPEQCNGLDDDCDGTVDEGLGGDACEGDAPGICAQGREVCVDGALACEPGAPADEACNDADDDCDGAVDEEGVCDPCTGVECPPGRVCNGGDCDLVDPACGDYVEVDDATRNLMAANGTACDAEGRADAVPFDTWFRFVPPAGERMSDEPTEQDVCGTDATGWLMGGHPATGDGVVRRTVCFSWRGNDCNWDTEIDVLDCAGFVLYRVPPVPICRLRYCAE